ncbi:TetR/AcrR family transcriptional regulator [Frankia sp. R82]|uniref:TetR/AcrR family transcriptional regulator n=1 Tax=Frankia sp. R82 TaxID=2950553 RepID=UPI00204416B3|nr:TetR/AcrR family transcriptional regulator [Frankia sp. R82]MCM3885316.1 TetR/AcrR family transcriptional regulator [Frankia sp. R82]
MASAVRASEAETVGQGPSGRSARKRQDIIGAATTLFLRNGYQGTSMDEVATRAGVSKQTVYKHFADKEELFRAIVEGVTGNSDQVVAELTAAFAGAEVRTLDDLVVRLTSVARHYLDAVLRGQVLSLRRLVIAETERFPDLARAYYDRAPSRGIDIIATALRTYVDGGLIAADDLRLAAAHFAYLTLSITQDKAMFSPADQPGEAERDYLSREAARVFVAAYQVR